MSDAGNQAAAATYVIPVVRVRQSIDRLLEQRSHQFFPAYLHLRSLAGRAGRLTELTPNWSELGSFYRVDGGPSGKPYLRPFWPRQRNAAQEWLASNLAGSYSPASLRGVPMRVIETDAQRRYTLRPHHWVLAREHLLFGRQLPALALAGYFLRDYGIRAEAAPSANDLIQLFRDTFGYRTPEDDEEFWYLYDTSWQGADGPWTEPWSPDEQG